MKQELQDMLDECTAELNDIEARINALPSLDKGRQYFTNYALIKACGTVEFVYRSIVADHFSQLTNSRIDSHVQKNVCYLLKNLMQLLTSLYPLLLLRHFESLFSIDHQIFRASSASFRTSHS